MIRSLRWRSGGEHSDPDRASCSGDLELAVEGITSLSDRERFRISKVGWLRMKTAAAFFQLVQFTDAKATTKVEQD